MKGMSLSAFKLTCIFYVNATVSAKLSAVVMSKCL